MKAERVGQDVAEFAAHSRREQEKGFIGFAKVQVVFDEEQDEQDEEEEEDEEWDLSESQFFNLNHQSRVLANTHRVQLLGASSLSSSPSSSPPSTSLPSSSSQSLNFSPTASSLALTTEVDNGLVCT